MAAKKHKMRRGSCGPIAEWGSRLSSFVSFEPFRGHSPSCPSWGKGNHEFHPACAESAAPWYDSTGNTALRLSAFGDQMEHDGLFKQVLTWFFVEFVAMLLPDLAKYLDPASIEFLDKEIITDLSARRRHVVDLLVKARFRGTGAGVFLVHVENQATSVADFARRMFIYFARLHEKFGLPIFPVAILSYGRPLRPEPNRYLVEFPGQEVLDFHYRAIQLNRLNWRDYLRKPNPVAAALMAKMRIAPEDRPKVKLECLRMLATLKLDPARSALIGTFMDRYLKLTAAEMKVYNRQVERLQPKEKDTVIKFTNQWTEKGRREGVREGLTKGLQARRELVLRQLGRRVGEVSPAARQRIDRLSEAAVDALGEALLDFAAPADLKAWLDDQETRRPRNSKNQTRSAK
jgi:hypothetical protein